MCVKLKLNYSAAREDIFDVIFAEFRQVSPAEPSARSAECVNKQILLGVQHEAKQKAAIYQISSRKLKFSI